jgi:hypothetical protein
MNIQKENYVTLFSVGFLPQGINLYNSMLKYCENFELWIMCMDEDTYLFLENANLQKVKFLRVTDFESEQMQEAKANRSLGEYCWTLSPFLPEIIFDLDNSIERVTYIDADIWFLKSPAEIFNEFELSGSSVLITEHDYIDEFNQVNSSGRFCVQFMIYNRDRSSEILQKWQNQCIEWCYNRVEDGKFGDQKYLDTWPEDFGGRVHVLQKKQYAQGPWNASKFAIENAIFFHFHQVRIVTDKVADIGYYPLKEEHIKILYKPYVEDLINSKLKLKQLKKRNVFLSFYIIILRIFGNIVRKTLLRHKLNTIWISASKPRGKDLILKTK